VKKVTLYSKSGRARTDLSALNRQSGIGLESEAVPVQDSGRRRYAARIRKFMARHERFFLVVSAGLVSMLLMIAYTASQPPVRQITQRNIDAAVMHTLDTNVLPSPETKAFKIVQRSVVRVRQLGQLQDKDPDRIRGVGTGVVIVDNGTILTNLHVVAGAERVQVVFFDGLVSDAAVIALQPENDLAVLQAMTIPDDLVPATLRSTADLAMGDKVIAVGFPFGLGPSVSSGIVSGLKREYQSPEGKRLLTNLIQFDAAANPGNSGGPLVTMDGAVVGIVTGILNPTVLRVFIGIGFAVPIENAATAAGTPPF
jgi:S1-C subfamily serine protease